MSDQMLYREAEEGEQGRGMVVVPVEPNYREASLKVADLLDAYVASNVRTTDDLVEWATQIVDAAYGGEPA